MSRSRSLNPKADKIVAAHPFLAGRLKMKPRPEPQPEPEPDAADAADLDGGEMRKEDLKEVAAETLQTAKDAAVETLQTAVSDSKARMLRLKEQKKAEMAAKKAAAVEKLTEAM